MRLNSVRAGLECRLRASWVQSPASGRSASLVAGPVLMLRLIRTWQSMSCTLHFANPKMLRTFEKALQVWLQNLLLVSLPALTGLGMIGGLWLKGIGAEGYVWKETGSAGQFWMFSLLTKRRGYTNQ